jgi:hypothetical protein
MRAEDGSFDVPEEAVADLLSHGFSPTKEPPQPEGPKAVSADVHAAALREITAVKVDRAEKDGKIEAVTSERNALEARVRDLEAQVEAGKKRPR